MLSAGQAGFANAPVTKAVICAVVVTTLFGSIIGSQKRLVLSLGAVASGQIWRLVTHHFVFSTPGELLFGVTLLYYFRQHERQMGSSRYFALAAFAGALHTAALCAAHFALPATAPRPASGPYSLIFAALVRFAFDTPAIYVFRLAGALALSDKTFPYLLALQLTLSAPARSLLPVATATIAGLAARVPVLANRLDAPRPLIDLASVTLLPLLNTTPVSAPHTTPRRMRTARGATAPGTAPPSDFANNPPMPSVAERAASLTGAHIDTLISMGFSRERSINALLRAGDDVQLATERLLAEGPN